MNTRKLPGRLGRIRRRVLWAHLGREEMTELKLLSNEIRSAYIAAVKCGALNNREPDSSNESDPLLLRGLTAARYMELCATCIRAISPAETRPPREIYRGWAEGRHGGLLDLPPRDARAFHVWLHDRARLGSHPFEFFRGRLMLVVESSGSQNSAMWLRLMGRKRRISPYVIVSAVALRDSDVAVCVEDAQRHAIYCAGEDYVGVAEDAVWDAGTPLWPTNSGIIDTTQTVLLSQLAASPTALAAIEWFD